MTVTQDVRKGDIIVDRVAGKKRMTPVRKVEFNVCSKPSVHINGSECYDWGTQVDVAFGDETLGDLKEVVDEKEEDVFPTEDDLRIAGENSIQAWNNYKVSV